MGLLISRYVRSFKYYIDICCNSDDGVVCKRIKEDDEGTSACIHIIVRSLSAGIVPSLFPWP